MQLGDLQGLLLWCSNEIQRQAVRALYSRLRHLGGLNPFCAFVVPFRTFLLRLGRLWHIPALRQYSCCAAVVKVEHKAP